MKKVLKLIEEKRLARNAAMPEVSKLVKKFGRSTVSYCINELREFDKKNIALEKARKELENSKIQIGL